MEYDYSRIEKKWQDYWKANGSYKVSNDAAKPGYYVLDMFPYPSGTGLHVGHPLGYIASDIFARYKRSRGFNVLHPMGYDAFGLPAEQYAIDHGIHPSISTQQNIENFRKQLDNIGFSYDWSREVRTSDPGFYKWTQWIFLQLFDSWYNRQTKTAESINVLIALFEKQGNIGHPCPGNTALFFSASEWNGFDETKKQQVLMDYRLSYCGYGEVNWCEALGTVLANDEVINGLSERGGFPVVKRKLRQWYLRITEYADRLLEGLQTVDFSDAMKEMQANWIGKSYGAEISFDIHSPSSALGTNNEQKLTVYTTRPDTIFGVDFMVIAPEHELVDIIKSKEETIAVDEYVAYVNSRSDRERMAEKKISGCFTGAYAINPFNNQSIPVWISEYVLAGYGTGAIMGVPCGDERDLRFAKHFNIPVTNIIGAAFNGEEANPTKEAILENSDFLTGMVMRDAIDVVNAKIEEMGIGKKKVNYRMRDAAFSRQRYWGEPFPIVWAPDVALTEADNSSEASSDKSAEAMAGMANEVSANKELIAHPLPVSELPVMLPDLDELKPGPGGEGPLSNLDSWKNYRGGIREVNTMPGYAGSSWYFLRYMDPHNENEFCSRKASDYWNQVDLYIGGTEHAVGHLLYSRMWTKFLFDLGYIGFQEPYKKLVNQGMIQGSSRFVFRLNGKAAEKFISNLLEVTFNDFEFRVPVINEKLQPDFISEKRKIEIEVTSQKSIQEKFGKRKNAINQEYKLIYISNEEVFEKRQEGIISFNAWLAGKLHSEEDYISPLNSKKKNYYATLFVVEGLNEDCYEKLHVDVNIVDGIELDIDAFKRSKPEYANAEVILLGDGKYICGVEVEKMSKSKFNTVNPDDLVTKYGADTFRMYEMFLGPIQDSKPWDTKGIEGVHRFLKKLWRLFYDDLKGKVWNEEKASDAELKVLHRTIKKIGEDNERFSFNTGVSGFMVCVNELHDLKCHKKEILQHLLILLSPYAPHIAEELWQLTGNKDSILDAPYPELQEKYLVETSHTYPVSVNGKMRTQADLSLQATQQEVEELVMNNPIILKWLEGKPPKKIIYVKGKMINVVV
ncbi:MAG: class I tRNA ligase family protein [Flavitalea sp.]